MRRCCNAVLRLEKFNVPAEISVTLWNCSSNSGIEQEIPDEEHAHGCLSFPMRNRVLRYQSFRRGKGSGDIVLSHGKSSGASQSLRSTAWSGEAGYLTAHSVLRICWGIMARGVDQVRNKSIIARLDCPAPAVMSWMTRNKFCIFSFIFLCLAGDWLWNPTRNAMCALIWLRFLCSGGFIFSFSPTQYAILFCRGGDCLGTGQYRPGGQRKSR